MTKAASPLPAHVLQPMSFRTRIFLVSIATTTVTLGLAAMLMSWSIRESLSEQIGQALTNQARLAAETLSDRPFRGTADLDAEAEAIGRLVDTRITFIAPDGAVVGDSDRAFGDLPTIDNHGDRPEIVQARAEGIGRARRYSTTVGHEMMYVAVRIDNPAAPELAFVRLSLPLTSVDAELASVRRLALVAFGVGLLAAFVMAGIVSVFLGRRVSEIARVAERYAAGDLTAPLRDYGTDEIGTVARVLDTSVQELGRRMAELHADRARMSAILRGMIEGVLVVNAQGRLELVNDAARRMLRLQDAPEGRHYLEIVRHPQVARQIGDALTGTVSDGEELTLPMDPGVVYVARTAPVDAASQRGAMLVLHDISDLRRADRIRRDFVANISHELRTPLTAVKGYVEALLDGSVAPHDAARTLETIARQTTRMERLVSDLLRLARLDAGQETLGRVPCSVHDLFNSVAADLAPLADPRGQRIEQAIGEGAETVNADPAKLFDVLHNLLENAVKHTPEGGVITMSARRGPAGVIFTVEDEGPGIPEPDLLRVFERFYQVDKSRARSPRDTGGTGLGLSIVKHLVELHGGRVAAANRPGGGAVFTVELPTA